MESCGEGMATRVGRLYPVRSKQKPPPGPLKFTLTHYPTETNLEFWRCQGLPCDERIIPSVACGSLLARDTAVRQASARSMGDLR